MTENHGVPGSNPGPATPRSPAKRARFKGPGLAAVPRLLYLISSSLHDDGAAQVTRSMNPFARGGQVERPHR